MSVGQHLKSNSGSLSVNQNAGAERSKTRADSTMAQGWMVSCLVVGMVVVLLIGLVLYQEFLDLAQRRAYINRRDEIVLALADAFSLVKDAETGQRGFILTGDETYLRPYEFAQKTLNDKIDHLRKLTSDEPDQQKVLDQLSKSVQKKLVELNSSLSLYRAKGEKAAVERVRTNYGRALMDDIRTEFEQLQSDERAIFAQNSNALRGKRDLFVQTFAFLAFAASVLFAAFGYFLNRYRRVLIAAREAEALLESQQRERIREVEAQAALLNLTHDTIMLRDLDSKITFWNRGAVEMYGFSQEEALGKTSHDLLKTVFPVPIAEIESALRDSGRWDGELVHTARGGRRVIADSRWALKKNQSGAPVEILEINNDITARKEAELTLLEALEGKAEEQRRKLASIVESSEDAIISISLDGIVQSWNKSAERLFGYSELEMIDSPISKFMPPERSGEETTILQALRRGETIEQFETTRQKKDGSLVNVSLSVSPLRDPSGKLFGASKILRDISERQRSQQSLQEKVLELQRSNEELEQFAYVCSHDLQEPLRIISNFTQLLAKRYKGKLDENADQFMEFTVDAAKRMQDLIQALLVYSRLQTKGQQFVPVDCNAAAAAAVSNLSLALKDSDAKIDIGTLPSVVGDKNQLTQLFQNLIANALKFHSDKPIEMKIEAVERGDDWLFSAKDNGIGLDMKFADRIFVIFQRLHEREQYAGSGIGLAICKKIVYRHGGKIWVESSPGNGCTFFFTLPKAAN